MLLEPAQRFELLGDESLSAATPAAQPGGARGGSHGSLVGLDLLVRRKVFQAVLDGEVFQRRWRRGVAEPLWLEQDQPSQARSLCLPCSGSKCIPNPFNRATNLMLTELPILVSPDLDKVVAEVFVQAAKINNENQ